MNKSIYVFLTIIFLVSSGFSQDITKQKVKLTEIERFHLKREKFDPNRNSQADLNSAIEKATKENKRIILDVGGEWCGWCISMDLFFMKNPKLEKLRDKNYVWLKINMSEENENKEFLSKYPEIEGYPHLFILEKDGTFLHSQGTAELEREFPQIIVPAKVKDKKAYRKKIEEERALAKYNLDRFTQFLNQWTIVK